MKTDEVTLMYTGGLDTTLAAAMLAQQYQRVHLLTFCNGFCIGAESAPLHRVRELKRMFGDDRYTHEVLYVTDLFKRLREDIVTYVRQYNYSPLIVDLCCRLSMDTRTVIYNLENDVPYVADGNSKEQTEIFIQRAGYTKEIRRFMGEFGVEYVTPVYDFGDRHARREALKEMGFSGGNRFLTMLQNMGFNNFSDQFGKQPICKWLWAPFILTSPIRDFPGIRRFQLSVPDAVEFRRNREEIAKAYIEEYFRNKLIDLDELLEKRQATSV